MMCSNLCVLQTYCIHNMLVCCWLVNYVRVVTSEAKFIHINYNPSGNQLMNWNVRFESYHGEDMHTRTYTLENNTINSNLLLCLHMFLRILYGHNPCHPTHHAIPVPSRHHAWPHSGAKRLRNRHENNSLAKC